MNNDVTVTALIRKLGPVRARLTSTQRWVVTPKGAGDHRLPGKGPKGRSHRNPRGSAQDVKGESYTARTPAMDSGFSRTLCGVVAGARLQPLCKDVCNCWILLS